MRIICPAEVTIIVRTQKLTVIRVEMPISLKFWFQIQALYFFMTAAGDETSQEPCFCCLTQHWPVPVAFKACVHTNCGWKYPDCTNCRLRTSCTDWNARYDFCRCKLHGKILSWGTEELYRMLYAFFWVFLRCLNFMCRRFGTLCLFHLHRQVGMKNFLIPNWLWRWNRESVPKRRHIKFRRRGITQMKAYSCIERFVWYPLV